MTVRLLAALVFSIGMAASGDVIAADDRRFAHIFVIIEENHGNNQIIGNAAAPNINRLAQQYGSATRFYGEVHPSESNYIAMLGGSTFGIHDDDAWYCTPGRVDTNCTKSLSGGYVDHTIKARSLMDQLAEHGLTWKGYFENLPAPGSKAVFFSPAGQPERLYAAKHNGFISFAAVQNDPKLPERIVGFDQLAGDLAHGGAPNYAHIVPNQCNDMHGLNKGSDVPADCDYDNQAGLIARGDAKVGELVHAIQSSPLWAAAENAAIVITWDEDEGAHKDHTDDQAQGCCGVEPGSAANFGGGQIPTIVITNHGPRGVQDATPYNHYALLRTTEDAFGIAEHLGSADDTAHGVRTMEKLFWK